MAKFQLYLQTEDPQHRIASSQPRMLHIFSTPVLQKPCILNLDFLLIFAIRYFNKKCSKMTPPDQAWHPRFVPEGAYPKPQDTYPGMVILFKWEPHSECISQTVRINILARQDDPLRIRILDGEDKYPSPLGSLSQTVRMKHEMRQGCILTVQDDYPKPQDAQGSLKMQFWRGYGNSVKMRQGCILRPRIFILDRQDPYPTR